MYTEIESVEALEAHLEGAGHLDHCVMQGLDLEGAGSSLCSVSCSDAVFLGCRLDAATLEHLHAHGALVFPRLLGRPYEPFRPTLYSPEELLDGYEEDRPRSFFESSRDARIYQHYRETKDAPSVMESLAQRLHDFAIDDAKDDLLKAAPLKRSVAIMGGHAMRRDDPAFAHVATIAQRLCRAGYFLVSGGGPGAMEATNLGAWLGGYDEGALSSAVQMLIEAPTFRDPGWIESSLAAKREFPEGRESLGIPTWFYGHEPSNLFATHVAKYFSNSLREDGLLALATHGVIFAPGSAGTVQEVFMDTAQNHYGTFGVISPMVFLGRRYWREELPVAPLLEALAGERTYASRIAYVDSVEEAAAFIEAHPPTPYEG